METSINELRFTKWQVCLNEWSVIKVTGADCIKFMHGQTTNEVNGLPENTATLNARLNRAGKIQSFFFNVKYGHNLLIFIQKSLSEELVKDLNAYVIMDDVEFKLSESKLWFRANDFNSEENTILGRFAGVTGAFSFEKHSSFPEISAINFNVLVELSGFPMFGKNINNNLFINETILNDLAISYKKGCFLGQETVSKIETNRGAAYYPMLIEFKNEPQIGDLFLDENKIGEILSYTFYENKYYAHTRLNRENRIIGKKILDGEVLSYPYFKNSTAIELAEELYDTGIIEFKNGNSQKAIELVNLSLGFHETTDAVEVLGVLYARINNFEEAIRCMDRLSLLDPSSVMAHTNKSLYLMKLGKIAEAEEEKSIATVLGFEKFGDEAKLKKKLEEEKQKNEMALVGREKMFKQVLEIDSEDNLANFGMADICFLRGDFYRSIEYLKNVISVNSKYSQAYLLLGKNYESISDLKTACEIYSRGITIAASQGAMMPANEMQSRLNSIIQKLNKTVTT